MNSKECAGSSGSRRSNFAMDTKDLRALADYNAWATRRLAPALQELPPEEFRRELGGSFPSIQRTVAHMVAAAELWLDRWKGAPWRPIAPISELPAEAPALLERWSAVDAAIVRFLSTLDDASRTIRLRNSQGGEFTHRFSEMVPHVVNHQSYHRGQVSTMLRQLGRKASSQDLIVYYREVGA
jgi:uncharacterized damage-inducible protein DinB